MDPKNTSLCETVAVAILRDPVNVSRSDPNYGGSIFFNPGGPGGSGIDYVRWAGYETHHKIEGPKHFDLVGFDPRGIGYSTPQPICFDSELDRQLYWHQQSIVGLPDKSEYALQYHYQAAKAFGQSCNSTIMQYMTTLLNIQDMLAIADALEPDVKDPLINYWGMSYGTFIGNTLASVYPHRIGKFVLDAVVSSSDFVSNRWGYAIVDLEKVHTKFYESCHTAGPSKCPLYEETVDLIRDKVDALLESLRFSPMPIWNSTIPHRKAQLLTLADLKAAMFSALYKPYREFEHLAEILHGLTQSPPNMTLASEIIQSIRDPHDPFEPVSMKPTNNSWDNAFPERSSKNSLDNSRIVLCTDGESVNDWTVDDLRSHISELTAISPLIGASWAAMITTCTGWPTSKRSPPHAHFAGPFGSKLSEYSTQRGAHPILFIGNKADPVCPQRVARSESVKHEGSVVLGTDIFGHVSVPISPSTCVLDVLKRYWNFGVLPEQGTVCKGSWDIDKWEMKEEDGDDV